MSGCFVGGLGLDKESSNGWEVCSTYCYIHINLNSCNILIIKKVDKILFFVIFSAPVLWRGIVAIINLQTIIYLQQSLQPCFVFLLQWLSYIISMNNLLQTINSTINCVIYFAHCEKIKGIYIIWHFCKTLK